MKQLYHAMLYILICTFSIASCRWESEETFIAPCDSTITWTPAPADTCFSLPINGLGQVVATTHWPFSSKPHFYPNDSNRFLYVSSWYEGDSSHIFITNHCTGEKEYLISVKSVYSPCWGATDWILFSSGFGPIHKIKSSGDSLMVLNPQSGMSEYFWMNNGLNIHTQLRKSSTERFSIILDLDGEIIDTLPQLISRGSFKNGRLATLYNYENAPFLGIMSIIDCTFTPLLLYYPAFTISSIDWLDDQTIIWSDSKGIRKANINSGEITFIKETPCDNLHYSFISASPDDSGRIFTTRLEYIYVTSDSLVKYQRISMLDTHTGQEWILGLE